MGERVMEVADRSRSQGIIEMSTTILDPPWVGGVEVAPEVSKKSRVGPLVLWPEGP